MAGKCNRCKGSGRIPTKSRSTWEIITNQPGTATCPKCKGTGEYGSSSSSSSSSSRSSGYSSSNSSSSHRHSKTCAGQGCYNSVEYDDRWDNIPRYCKTCLSTWYEKSCSQTGCTNTIRYKKSFDNVSSYCGYCTKKRQEGWNANRCSDCSGLLWVAPGKNWTRCAKCSAANKKTKRCKNPLCSNTIEYYASDTKQYDYCRDCTSWKEKHCAVATCTTPVKYKGMWDNIPSYCQFHLKEMQQRQHPKYDEATSKEYPSIHAALPGSSRTAADMGGEKVVVLGFPDGHKHVSVFSGRKGDPGNWRYSWNVDSYGRYEKGSAHFSDDGSTLVRGKFSDETRWFNG